MGTEWIALPASLLLAAGATALTALRTALLILGEDGLEEAGADEPPAARLLAAIRDPTYRHPFGLWATATLLKACSALSAGAAAIAFRQSLPGWPGLGVALGWALAWLLLLFLLEHLATHGVMRNPWRAIRRGGAGVLRAIRVAGAVGRAIDRLGRWLFGDEYSPEGLMDIRFGSEEGILDVIEEGAEHGTIDPVEERMIEGVLRFGETTVAELMTARSDAAFLRSGMSRSEVDGVIGATGFSRYPVLSADGEAVVGVLQTQNLFRKEAAGGWERLVDRPVYVPDSMKVADLFHQFQRSRSHLAVVIDEHGKLCGVITLYDVIEQILGRLSEGDAADELPEWENDGSLSVPAATPVRILREEFEIDIPMSAAYETAGGFALDCLQDVPEGAVAFRAGDYRVTVVETERFRIRRLRFEKIPR
ncbi:MAG TPA: CBS domain-containing protein [Candidatus Deferrimicrobiaceae bacterium]|jgi:CBS domain containing-hemolysin-like protein